MVTTYDIAKKAGLNQSTVSRVLSGSPLVNPKTAEKVWKVCRELDYVPNAQARALRTQRAQAICIYLPQYSETILADPFVPAFLSGASRGATACGYGTVLCYHDEDVRARTLIEMVHSHRVDGVIMASPAHHDPVLSRLIAENIPVVTGRADAEFSRHVATVDIDNEHAGFQSVQFLLQRYNAEQIGLVAEEPGVLSGEDFERGYRRALRAAGKHPDPGLIRRVPVTFAAAQKATHEILIQAPDIDAMIADTALGVFGVLHALAQAGSHSVVLGVESPLLRAMHPELPLIQSPIQELGYKMAQTLILQLQKPGQAQVREMLYTTIIDKTGQSFFVDKESSSDSKKTKISKAKKNFPQ